MDLLYQSAFMEALGWSLVDSLWQTGALWMLYVLLTWNGKKFTSSARYAIAAAILILSGSWFIENLIVDYQDLIHGKPVRSVSFYVRQQLSDALPSTGFLDASIPVLSFIYIGLLAFFAIKFLGAFVKSKELLHTGLMEADDYIIEAMNRLITRTGIRKKVKIWLSDTVHSALTLGSIKPVILLPVAMVNQLSIAQTEAIIAHELFHIRRNDYLMNILLSMAGLILFFNPFARILHTIIRKERENCCDDEVLSLGYSSWEYSESLYLLGASSLDQNKFALALSGNNHLLLLGRIKRILKYKQPGASILKPVCLFLLCLGLAIFGKKSPVVKEELAGPKTYLPAFPLQNIAGREKTVMIVRTIPGGKPAVHFREKTIQIKVSLAHRPAQIAASIIPPVPQDQKDRQDDRVDVSAQPVNRSFVSVKTEQVEFTIIETTPVVPQVTNAGKLMPYVPASTFYFPGNTDTTTSGEAKKAVSI